MLYIYITVVSRAAPVACRVSLCVVRWLLRTAPFAGRVGIYEAVSTVTVLNSDRYPENKNKLDGGSCTEVLGVQGFRKPKRSRPLRSFTWFGMATTPFEMKLGFCLVPMDPLII